MINLKLSPRLLMNSRAAQVLTHLTVALAACLMQAETRAQVTPASPSVADPYLFQDLGGQAGLSHLVADFADRLTKHPHSRALFADVKMDRFRDKLTEQLCEVSGGPCKYSGDPMSEVHQGMKLTAADFNVTVEMLQASMDAAGLSFRVQNRLLAKLAPMHRQITAQK